MKQKQKFLSKQFISLLLAVVMILPNFALPVQAIDALPEAGETNMTEVLPEIDAVPEETPDEVPEIEVPEETPDVVAPEEMPEVIVPEEPQVELPEVIGPDMEQLPEMEEGQMPVFLSDQVTMPVGPKDPSKVIHIASGEEMSKIDPSDSTAYYVLDNDITLVKYKYTHTTGFCGTFDGRGHTVTFPGGRKCPEYLFKTIEAGAVVQNVRFAGNLPGTFKNNGEHGPCGMTVKGSVINCVSSVGGEAPSGFTYELNNGVISNCISVGQAVINAVCAKYTAGTVENTYWSDTLTDKVPEGALVNSGARDAAGMSAAVDTLNANIGQYGCKWVLGSDGMPTLEPSALEIEEGPKEPVLCFKRTNGEKVYPEGDTFTLSALDEGSFVLEGAETELNWDCATKPDGVNTHNWISANGRYCPHSVATVTATVKEKASGKVLKTFQINNVSIDVDALKVYIDGKEVTMDQPYQTDGTNRVPVTVKGRKKGTDNWVVIPVSAAWVGETSGNGMFRPDGTIQVHNNGEAIFTVTLRENDLTVQFKATAGTVHVQNFHVTVPEVWEIHEWNDLGPYWLGIKPGTDTKRQFQVTFEPANAGNKKLKWEALDPDVAEYMVAFDNGIVPKKAGTARFKVTSEDNPELTQMVQVKFVYRTPLQSATVEKDSFRIEQGEAPDFTIHTIPEDASEQRFDWTFDQEGIVKVGDTINNDTSNVSTPKWTTHTITALKPGVVHVTGTPKDQTGKCQNIYFTVTVTKNGAAPDESGTQAMAKADLQHGVAELSKHPISQYGQEWSVFAILRAGRTIPQDQLNQYYASVEATAKSSLKDDKSIDFKKLSPTDIARVVIALEAMGKDPKNVGGVDLLEQLYNSDSIEKVTSNGAIFALIALDGWKSQIPENAKWTRDRLINKILSYQTNEGGFGLIDANTCSVDMTAMAVQGLAPYYQSNSNVHQAVDKALEYLKGQMNSNAGYVTSGGSASCTAAQVLVALSALKLDAADAKNGFTRGENTLISFLRSCKAQTGGFGKNDGSETDGMSTDQVTYALAAYDRLISGKTALYDFTDTMKEQPHVDPDSSVKPEPEHPVKPEPEHPVKPEPEHPVKPEPEHPVKPEPPVKPDRPSKPDRTTVTLSVDIETIGGGYIVAPTKVKISAGNTVWDVLKAVLDTYNIPCESSHSAQYGSIYVKSINGIGEFDNGPGSGWMYNVNGFYPGFGCSKYELKGGETIQWRYTTNLGEDLKDANGTNGATPDAHNDPNKTDKTDKEDNAVVDPTFPFADARYHWAKNAIAYVYENNLMVGTSSNAFTPDGTLNRAMLATILYRMAGSPSVSSVNVFSDVKEGTWYTDAIIWASENGIVNGVSAGLFAPMADVTREQMAAMLHRYAMASGVNVNKTSNLSFFADANQIDDWALAAMEWANAEGLIVGRSASSIAPDDMATRAEAATILMRFDMSIA